MLLDIQLPGPLNGIRVLEEMRRRYPDLGVPVIAFTAYALPGDAERLLSYGFDGYIGKPFTRKELVAAIEEVLR